MFKLQLRIAKWADELARILGRSPGHSFELWRQAEGEVWDFITSNDQARQEFAAISDLADSTVAKPVKI